jgi:type I restriction enzyme M protein
MKLVSTAWILGLGRFAVKLTIASSEIGRQSEAAAVYNRCHNIMRSIFQLTHAAKILQKSQPPEILFIERCVQFLVEGSGRMAMVIPNGILNNPALGYVRQWMLQNTQIIAVVDIERDLFQPKNATQTSMVLMRRLSSEERERSVFSLDEKSWRALHLMFSVLDVERNRHTVCKGALNFI